MEDKLFELMTKMYSDITDRLDSIDNKLDEKSDKNDIVRIEDKLYALTLRRCITLQCLKKYHCGY